MQCTLNINTYTYVNRGFKLFLKTKPTENQNGKKENKRQINILF